MRPLTVVSPPLGGGGVLPPPPPPPPPHAVMDIAAVATARHLVKVNLRRALIGCREET
jgi:hypothetical protein